MNRKQLILPVFLSALLGLFAIGAAASSSAKVAPTAPAQLRNLLHNGGFELWVKPTAQQAAAQGKGFPTLLSGLVPAGWQYMDQIRYGSGPIKGAVARDSKVRHGGKYSLRIVNGLPTDITDVSQMIPCKPNTIYRFSCYIKGLDIKPDHGNGTGAMVWLNYGPKDFWPHQTASSHLPHRFKGTFGWGKLSFTVDTGPEAAFLTAAVQLRCASGTIWYDDVKVVKAGRYKHVKSY